MESAENTTNPPVTETALSSQESADSSTTDPDYIHSIKYMDDVLLVSNDKSNFPTQEEMDLNNKC